MRQKGGATSNDSCFPCECTEPINIQVPHSGEVEPDSKRLHMPQLDPQDRKNPDSSLPPSLPFLPACSARPYRGTCRRRPSPRAIIDLKG